MPDPAATPTAPADDGLLGPLPAGGSPVPPAVPPAPAAEFAEDFFGLALPAQDKPKGLPDQYWDPEKKAVRVGTLAKRLSDTQKALHEKGAPKKAPDEYKINLAEDFKKAGIEIDPKSKLFEGVVGAFKKHGVPQEAFDELVNLYAMDLQGAVPDPAAEKGALAKDFGERTEGILSENKRWLGAVLEGAPTDVAEMVNYLTHTAAGVKTINFFRGLATKGMDVPGSKGSGERAPAALTKEQIYSRMQDPRSNPMAAAFDPAFLKETEELLKRQSGEK